MGEHAHRSGECCPGQRTVPTWRFSNLTLPMKPAFSALILLLMPWFFLGQERAVNKALSKSPEAYALFDEQGKPAAWSILWKRHGRRCGALWRIPR